MSYSFLSNYCTRDPFLRYKTRVNVYMVLGRGVVGSCFGVRYCSYLGGGGFHALVNLLVYKIPVPCTRRLRRRVQGTGTPSSELTRLEPVLNTHRLLMLGLRLSGTYLHSFCLFTTCSLTFWCRNYFFNFSTPCI